MANAAAKKAAAAKATVASTYNPILLGTNLVYLLLVFGSRRSLSKWEIMGMLCTWALQAYSYVGIIEDAANKSGGSSSKKSKKDTALVGGAHLDLLAVTWIIQFGTTLWSARFYWILAMIPPWGGWKVYTTFFQKPSVPGGNSASYQSVAPSNGEDEDPAKKDRRERRAEKRRQKWA